MDVLPAYRDKLASLRPDQVFMFILIKKRKSVAYYRYIDSVSSMYAVCMGTI